MNIPATAAGIDLGGTKIETQIFDDAWQVIARQRVPTPSDYPALVQALADQVRWAEAQGGAGLPVGIGAAGLVNPATGLALTANLCATGKPLPADIVAAAGRNVLYVNDCRALALSEAVFGAGRGHRTVLGLILGTGVGGGVAIDGALMAGPTMTGGEFGHISADCAVVAQFGLPIVTCGCGQAGCVETLIAGPGMVRLAAVMGLPDATPEDIGTGQGPFGDVLARWAALMGAFLKTLTRTIDPDIIVIGGGLSKLPDLTARLSDALGSVQFDGFSIPQIAIAQGGDSSGARGAAYAALSTGKGAS